jgi:uncharacterized membrane protein
MAMNLMVFLVGAVGMLVSNIFFGEGPWAPWQMFSMGAVGFFAGMIFNKGFLNKNKIIICIYGFVSTYVLYGGIMNTSQVLMLQSYPTKEMFYISFLNGMPFDLIHAVSTFVFLWLIVKPMSEKIERIKIKYGLLK